MLSRLVGVSSRRPRRDCLATACAPARGARDQRGRADGARPPLGEGPRTRAAASNLSEAAHDRQGRAMQLRDAHLVTTPAPNHQRPAPWRIAGASHEGLHARHCRALARPPIPPARGNPSRLRHSRIAKAVGPGARHAVAEARAYAASGPRCPSGASGFLRGECGVLANERACRRRQRGRVLCPWSLRVPSSAVLPLRQGSVDASDECVGVG
jgi:hypothetical protein